jgi:hypothetical protein
MKKALSKPISLAFISLLVLSTLMVVYTPVAESGTFESSGKFEGTIEPQVVSGAYPYPTQKFTFNITFLADTDEVVITFPTGWTFVSAYAENHTLIWDTITDTLTDVTFSNSTSASTDTDVWEIFYVTVVVATSGYDTVTWGIDTLLSGNPVGSDTVDVSVTPWFDATISPVVIQGSKTQWFDIVITNNASTPSIYKVKITYPDTGWVYGDVEAPPNWVIYEHNTGLKYIIFMATGGYEIKPNKSATFRFYMTTGSVNGDWVIECTNTAAEAATMTLTVTIDNDAPTITINNPTPSQMTNGYSVGAGNYVWINTTITDNWDALPTIVINASFTYTYRRTGVGTWTVNFYNTTAILDGDLVFYINATDAAGNIGTTGAETVAINNLAPKIIEIKLYDHLEEPLPEPEPGKFYISNTETAIYVNVTVWEPHLDIANSKVYMNTTYLYTIDTDTNNTMKGPYTVEASNYAIINVTTFDTASPVKHSFNKTVELIRDLVPPYEIGFVSVKPICGGLVIYGLYAKDTVAVYEYVFKVNETVKTISVPQAHLESTEWTGDAFSGIAVLDLAEYAGEYVNITVLAKDYGLNEGEEIVVYAGEIPEGTWYAIELYKGYNLVSLPLIPNSTARADIYSLILKQGAEGVKITYSFDNQAKTWTMNPATMTDGAGYWINMKAYDVLIVQGTPIEEYWGLEPIHYLLYKGWNLVGYTAIEEGSASDYLGSLDTNSYYRYVYVWNAKDQKWTMVKAVGDNPGKLSPGQGFWILLYSDQTLIPPVPTL